MCVCVCNLFRATHASRRVMNEGGGLVGGGLMTLLLWNTDLGMLVRSAAGYSVTSFVLSGVSGS